ncbi:MAG: hypothetical protein WDN76_04690 [Alphaproteobacteria bacterium]
MAKRIENYIVGRDPIALVTPTEVALARAESLQTIAKIVGNQAAIE